MRFFSWIVWTRVICPQQRTAQPSIAPANGRGKTHHLARRHAHGLDRELAAAHVEQVLETRPEEVDNEDIMEPLLPKVVYLRNPRCRAGGAARSASGGRAQATARG